ncbi:MAG: MFS transporter [SAR324 cluster bacterium]|uniref:MFS transporter n=2 Tax=SAR324 cluster bacterium TaxID=2024889 RepID=A0A432GQN3_9DELT|nr:MAG: MFS transporter [SAR324 cluster bacterium]
MSESAKTTIFTLSEKRSIYSLSGVLFFRMFSLFLLLPVFSVLAMDLEGATPFLIGVAFGAYGLTQGFLQLPFGMWSDRAGRKLVIVIGLGLFIAGNLLAAFVDSIHWMIVARFLQGTGAISSTVFALIADLTRPEVRTRANAALGASVGIAFALAFGAAPFFGEWLGLNGMFLMIAVLSLASLVLVLTTVPNPETIKLLPQKVSFWNMAKMVWKVPALRTISWGGFVCGAGLSSTFFLIPMILVQHGFERAEMWKIYLPMMLAGVVAMVLAAIFAEVKNRFREVMLFGIVLLLTSLVFMGLGQEQNRLIWFVAALYFFFMGFNVFEPIFPSLVTRSTTSETKGTAMGVYNFAQFIGHFVGATVAGALYVNNYLIFILLLAVAEIWFFYLTLSFQNPEKKIKTK